MRDQDTAADAGQAKVKDIERRFERTMRVAEAIVEHLGAAKQYGAGQMACPIEGCSGVVDYSVVHSSRSSTRRAIRARCSGKDCVSFME